MTVSNQPSGQGGDLGFPARQTDEQGQAITGPNGAKGAPPPHICIPVQHIAINTQQLGDNYDHS